ncbi:hypothetical protein BAUCODRAFT_524374 [Baudoinia panamericana UAMH 10762]|uniref:Bromo domain-containing protein n=1 Tax=Baudoinia panamericana (strain UAMH 10762) TaxID=717646 RepID=M2MEQ5_BAUPA|nr:uncharacterized protein BAUCODRAFT_524374 [Baudoinia panamericana UAMH 10762]EMC95056.1 hypothetical protein BAUCODRAFT_524374 [Baudoinia panamericana UAMH 10762]
MTSLSTTTAYTPLEQLLLFQALRVEGSNSTATINFSFNRISDQLKAIPTIHNDPTYDSGRLSPDALRELYLWLLKDEVKRDLERQAEKESHATTNGDASPASRKRKAPSPTVPTVQEAAQHSYLIPQLVNRLYATYRDRLVKELRDHERKYDALSRDISEIEAGKWDERLQRQRTVSATQSPKASPRVRSQLIEQRPDTATTTKDAAASATVPEKAAEPNVQPPPRKSTIDAMINHEPEPPAAPSSHSRTPSNSALPPLSEMAPHSPRFGIPPMPGPVAAGMPPPYGHSPPANHPSSYAPHHAHPVPSPQLQNAMTRPSSSPRPILPPPAGMRLPPPSPIQHASSPAHRGPGMPAQQYYQPQHRSSLGPSPTNDRPSHGYAAQYPPAVPYYQQQPVYADRRTSFPPQQAQQPPLAHQRFPVQAPHQSGHQYGWHVDGSQHAKMPPKQQPPLSIPQNSRPIQPQSYTPHHPPPNPPSQSLFTSSKQQPDQQRLVSSIIAALATPPRRRSTPSQAQQKPLWKSEHRPPPVGVPFAAESPLVEPLSPVQRRARSPVKQPPGVRRERTASPSGESEKPQPTTQPAGRRTRATRNRSPHSVTSTADDLARTRTRSQSVSTAAEGQPTPVQRTIKRTTVKAEPSTPAEVVDAPDHIPEHSATPASGPMTRKRRGTIQSLPHQPPASKRRRQDSPSAAPDTANAEVDDTTPPPRPTTILATRNFAKMAATIMNDITSHKHAAWFANPIREKDAEGYSEIIKQPQHLKSIRAAITAGTRAVAAAVAQLGSPPPGAEVSTMIELERTPELVPPRAIVNADQLEKEVYRMLANAVMFNPGEDGIVGEAREMFADVVGKIGEWRGAERDAGVVEDEEGGGGKAKRRKV